MNEYTKYETGFLYSDPSFISGAATIFNLAGNFYQFNSSASETEADCRAVESDFNIVGEDLRRAIEKVTGV